MQNKKSEKKVWKTTGNVLFLIIVVIIVSSYLYQSFQIDLIMQDMHALQVKKKQLLSETENLQAEVERLSNIDRISRKAIKDFGLEFSNENQFAIKIGDTDDLIELKEKFAQEDLKIEKIKTAGIQ
jgi:cell division protein FtsL